MTNTPEELCLGSRKIGMNRPAFVIAEIGMNHNGDTGLGMQMIRAAANSGADAVKIQSFKTERFLSSSTFDCDERRKYEMDAAAHAQLRDCAHSEGLEFLSSALDDQSVDLLLELGVGILKVASCDLTNLPLLEIIGMTRKPVLLSTGYSQIREIERARECLLSNGCPWLSIMHCVAVYPTPDEDMHLNNIPMLRNRFPEHITGLSDHSPDAGLLPACAVALGARIVEKHFTTDHNLPGYDHAMSLTPDAFAGMVRSIRRVEQALGRTRLETGAIHSESERRTKARRSLFWHRNLKKGDTIVPGDILPKRPGTGLEPAMLNRFLGKTLATDVAADTPVEAAQTGA